MTTRASEARRSESMHSKPNEVQLASRDTSGRPSRSERRHLHPVDPVSVDLGPVTTLCWPVTTRHPGPMDETTGKPAGNQLAADQPPPVPREAGMILGRGRSTTQ